MKTEENNSHEKWERPDDFFGRFLDRIAVCLAVFGGLILVAIVSVNSLSIFGRFLFSSPLVGDFELVEMGCAVSVAAFLPLCFMRKGNVIVGFVTSGLPSWMTGLLDTFGSLVFGIVAGFFAWRMYFGAKDMMYYNEETMLLQIPVWIPFLPIVFSFFVLSVCCFYVAGCDARKFLFRV